MNQKTAVRNLKCNYSDEEIAEFKNNLVGGLMELENLEIEKKEFNTDISAKIKNKTSEISTLVHSINTGYEYRIVDCDIKIDIDKNEKLIIRTDTNEVIETLTLSDEERQLEIQANEESEVEDSVENVDEENAEKIEKVKDEK